MFIDGVYYGSRSAAVDREECPRMRFLGTDYNGTGYSPIAQRVPLIGGIHEHNVLADIVGHYGGIKLLEGADPVETALQKVKAAYTEEILEAGIRDLTDAEVVFTMQEQLTMLEGMTRGFVIYRLPRLMEEYDLVETEQEWLWDLGPGVKWPMRVDALYRRKVDGMHIIADYKGIPHGDDAWQRTHENSKQTMLYITAMEERLGEPIAGVMYEGMVRGYWRTDTAKSSPFFGRRIQQSPYCYGYQNTDGLGSAPVRQSAYTNRKGFYKFRVADELPVVEWLEVLIEEGVLPELFIKMEPASPAPELRERIRQQTLLAEQRYIDDLLAFEELRDRWGIEDPRVQAHLDLMAPQHTGRCFKYGQDHRCPFAEPGLCLSPGAGLDSIPNDPLFKQRVPHHDVSKLIPLKVVA